MLPHLDVIAVDSSPLDDVSVLQRVALVMARGNLYLGVTQFPPLRCKWGFGLPAPALLSVDIDD